MSDLERDGGYRDWDETVVRQSAIAVAASGVTLTSTGWIREYLSINYGIPHVDNTEHLPAKIAAVAATLIGHDGAKPAHLDRVARQALEHTVAQATKRHPPWRALDQPKRWTAARGC